MTVSKHSQDVPSWLCLETVIKTEKKRSPETCRFYNRIKFG